jgi:hypothetical protein
MMQTSYDVHAGADDLPTRKIHASGITGEKNRQLERRCVPADDAFAC